MTWSYWGCNGRENTISIRSSHLGYVVPRSSLLGLVMLLNGLPFMTCWLALWTISWMTSSYENQRNLSAAQISAPSSSWFTIWGSPIVQEETIGPTQVIELLGMLIDSIRLEAGLPWDKIKHIREALCRWECRKSCTLKELQSLIDTLHFACKVVPQIAPSSKGWLLSQKSLLNLTVTLDSIMDLERTLECGNSS